LNPILPYPFHIHPYPTIYTNPAYTITQWWMPDLTVYHPRPLLSWFLCSHWCQGRRCSWWEGTAAVLSFGNGDRAIQLDL
jgi:hypothetical protein